MPSVFAVANPKGGREKSTVAILLAGEFDKRGYSIAIAIVGARRRDRALERLRPRGNRHPYYYGDIPI